MLNKINRLLNSPSDEVRFYHKNCPVTEKMFAGLVACYSEKIRKNKNKKAVLYCEDTFLFFVGFFALLCARKDILLPAQYNESLKSGFDSDFVVTDLDMEQAIILNADIPVLAESTLGTISSATQIVFYTSGSSGKPKEIIKNFHHLIEETKYLAKLFKDQLLKKPVVLSTVNANHMYGIFYQFLLPVYCDLQIDTSFVFTPESLDELLQKHETTFLVSSPAFLSRITQYSDEYTFSKKPAVITSAGGILKNALAHKIQKMFGVMPTEIYGSTETGGIAYRKQDESEYWTFFEPVQGVADENSCLTVTSSFINMPYATADIVEFIDDTHFSLKGRADRLVKFEENRVFLPEIEDFLGNNAFVEQAYVSLIESARTFLGALITLTETGKEFVIKNGKKALIDAIKLLLVQKIEPVCLPSKWRILDELPFNRQGKITKGNTLALFSNNLAEPVVVRKIIHEKEITLELVFLKDASYFKGHFPNLAILPGVVQIHFAIYWAKKYLSSQASIQKISRLKFTRLVFPGDTVFLSIKKTTKGIEFKYHNTEAVFATGIIMEGTNV